MLPAALIFDDAIVPVTVSLEISTTPAGPRMMLELVKLPLIVSDPTGIDEVMLLPLTEPSVIEAAALAPAAASWMLEPLTAPS